MPQVWTALSRNLKVLSGIAISAIQPSSTMFVLTYHTPSQLVFISRPSLIIWESVLAPAAFVDALFANAGVVPSEAERAAAINEFGLAPTIADAAARARALRRVAEHPTLIQREFNNAFVLMQYFGYLRRDPNDAPEATLDFQGYNFWLNKLNSFNGNFVQAEMVKAFISSAEYRRRFGL